MPEQRRKFSPQFKAEAVQMVIETGRPTAEVARDLGVHDRTLGNWVNACRRENPEPEEALTPVERARHLQDRLDVSAGGGSAVQFLHPVTSAVLDSAHTKCRGMCLYRGQAGGHAPGMTTGTPVATRHGPVGVLRCNAALRGSPP